MSKYQEKILLALQLCSIDYLLTVPTSGINDVYNHFEKDGRCIYVTREDEAVSLASGLRMGNKIPLVLVQQSGVGNMLNAIFTLAEPYQIPFSVLVLFRGEEDENAIHHFSSQKTAHILQSLGGSLIDWSDEDAHTKFALRFKEGTRWIYGNY